MTPDDVTYVRSLVTDSDDTFQAWTLALCDALEQSWAGRTKDQRNEAVAALARVQALCDDPVGWATQSGMFFIPLKRVRAAITGP